MKAGDDVCFMFLEGLGSIKIVMSFRRNWEVSVFQKSKFKKNLKKENDLTVEKI